MCEFIENKVQNKHRLFSPGNVFSPIRWNLADSLVELMKASMTRKSNLASLRVEGFFQRPQANTSSEGPSPLTSPCSWVTTMYKVFHPNQSFLMALPQRESMKYC